MSLSLLENLAVKKPAVSKKKFDVAIPFQKVEIGTTIVDKTKQAIVLRDEFIKKLKPENLAVTKKTVVPMQISSTKKKALEQLTKKEPEQASQAIVAPIEPVMQQPLPDQEPSIKIIKKKKRKLKLVEKSVTEQPTLAKEPDVAKETVQPNTLVVADDTKKSRAPRTFASPIGVVKDKPISSLYIGDEILLERIGKKNIMPNLPKSPYYMNNRKIFINFMSKLFKNYKKEIAENSGKASCDSVGGEEFSLMAHQKIVRDYINLYTPYRGLLLFHGLGSGKTCTSIAIAEGMKTSKQVIVMTPASLRMNYIEELKKCGDTIYRKNQFWEFINTKTQPELINALSNVLAISVEFINKQGGAWLVNLKKPANFAELSSEDKASVDNQINEMINHKYKFINYNGMRSNHLRALSNNYTINPFDNKVIIIDEAHNFVSRIVNKLTKKESLSLKLYSYLMDADNVKIVFLSGTPMINYPNELGILYNILRGRIKSWSFKLKIKDQTKVTNETFHKMFNSKVMGGKMVDYINYKPTTTTLTITRNPFGFVNTERKGAYTGVRLSEQGTMSDEDFVKIITKVIKKNKIEVIPRSTLITKYNALPDTLDDFKSLFIDEKNNIKNPDLFKRRIMGLTSYFRSAQESLMPRYSKSKDFYVLKIPMSDFQFGVYEEARVQERKLELRNAKKKKRQGDGVFEDTVSTYRIFSRAFCNFVFPKPDINRPMPGDSENLEDAIINEKSDLDMLDIKSTEEKINDVDGKYEREEVEQKEAEESVEIRSYQEKIKDVLEELKVNSSTYLSPEGLKTYSPKFLNMLENIQNPDHQGLHLIYSQFRTLEGIGIFKLVLEANGFAQFKVKQVGGNWVIDVKEEDYSKPKFVLYTGTETAEEKEIMRNIFNGFWDVIPTTLVEPLQKIAVNNNMGEVVKIFMITASGAEGISLKNVRYVHITEPYWHPVRTQQVIGRARRICSHKDLPEELQTVDVFLYLMTFTEEQLTSDKSIELRLKDKGKKTDRALTSDEALYEISTIKEDVADQLLEYVKESSIDCALHSGTGEKTSVNCLSFGSATSESFSYQPALTDEETDKVARQNKQEVKVKLNALEIDGVKYAYNVKTKEVFDYDSYKRRNLVLIGHIEFLEDKKFRLVPI